MKPFCIKFEERQLRFLEDYAERTQRTKAGVARFALDRLREAVARDGQGEQQQENDESSIGSSEN